MTPLFLVQFDDGSSVSFYRDGSNRYFGSPLQTVKMTQAFLDGEVSWQGMTQICDHMRAKAVACAENIIAAQS